MADKQRMVGNVWAVVFSNYSPTQVDTLWSTKADAEKALESFGPGGMWHIEELSILKLVPADDEPQAQPDEGKSLWESTEQTPRQTAEEVFSERVKGMRVVACGCLHRVVGSRLERRGPSFIAGCPDCGGSGYVIREGDA